MKTFTKALLEDTIADLLETRSEELDNLVNSDLIMQYYTMACEDIWYRLTGNQLNVGQDIEPEDWDNV